MRNPSSYRTILFTLAAFLLTQFPYAGTPVFRRLTVADGLPSHTWAALAQDQRGFLWLGGMAGLFRYDGVEFIPVFTADGRPLPPVYSLCVSNAVPGTIYAGVENEGLYRIRGTSAAPFCEDSSFRESFPRSIIEVSPGLLWATTGSSLVRIENGKHQRIPLPFAGGTVSKIVTDASGAMYLLCGSEGLVQVMWNVAEQRWVVQARWKEIGAATPFADGIAAWDPSGVVVWIRSGTTVRRWMVKECAVPAQEMIVENDSTVWLGNVDGLHRISTVNGSITHNSVSVQDGLPERFVVPAMADRDGAVWFRTFSKGLLRTVHRSTRVIPCTPAPVVSNNAAMVAEGSGSLFASTTEGIMEIRHVYDRWEHSFRSPILPPQSGFPNGFAAGPRGMIAVKHWYGDIAVLMNARERTPFSIIDAHGFAPGAYRTVIAFDRAGRLWCAAERNGIAVYDVRKGTVTDPVITLTDPAFRTITAMCAMHDGTMWTADKQGHLSIVSLPVDGAPVIRRLPYFESRPTVQLRALTQDAGGSVWVGTKNHGVFLFDGTGATVIDSVMDASLMQLHALSPDGRGGILAATMEGIVHITRDGKQWNVETVVRQRSMFSCGLSGDSLLWGMGEGGAVLHRWRSETIHSSSLPVHITGVTVNGASVDTSNGLDLPYDRNNITVSFTGIRFDPEVRLSYRYRLLPSDTGWREIGTQRSVSFAALAPGRYTVEVLAASGSAETAIVPASVSFVLRPPWWRTWWFAAAVTALIALIVVLVVRIRLRRWQEVERLRQRIAADLHDEVGSTLSGISLLSGVAEAEVRSDPEAAAERVRGIGASARAMMESMSDIVWTIDPANDPLERFLLRFREYAAELFEAKQIRYEFHITGSGVTLPMDRRRHLYLLMKEAVTNIVRHAGASFVRITIAAEGRRLSVTIEDDGCGMEEQGVRTGNGIPNMRRRAEMMGAQLSLVTSKTKGTKILVIV